jgi:hypothetical protein
MRASDHTFQVGRIGVRPFVRAAWEHEYKESALPFRPGASYLAASLNANEAAINFLTFSAVSPFR